MGKYKDCLACTNSFSIEGENGEYDSLYCIEKGKKVKENECCDSFKN